MNNLNRKAILKVCDHLFNKMIAQPYIGDGLVRIDELIIELDISIHDIPHIMDALISLHVVKKSGSCYIVDLDYRLEDEEINKLKSDAYKKVAVEQLRIAASAVHTWAGTCNVGTERTNAFEIYNTIRMAQYNV